MYENSNNIYGYIDIGFFLVASDIQVAIDTFNSTDLKTIAEKLKEDMPSFNLSHVGNSIVYTPGGVSIQKGHLPAHTNNFLEIMADGSARMRILLINNDPEKLSVNMTIPMTILNSYREVYAKVMGTLFPYKIAYAKKYESLTVRKQFQPVMFYDDAVLELYPDLQQDNVKMREAIQSHRKIFGTTTIVTDDRIPKTGLYTIDKRNLELWGHAYTAEAIIDNLFSSRYTALAFFPFQRTTKA